jgi:hypothetical protein
MGAEVGATTSTFPYTSNMRSYLHATWRGPVARAADNAAEAGYLSADKGAEYDEVIEIVRRLVFVNFTVFTHAFDYRTCLNSSLRLTDLSLLTLQHLSLSSVILLSLKDGRTKSLLV